MTTNNLRTYQIIPQRCTNYHTPITERSVGAKSNQDMSDETAKLQRQIGTATAEKTSKITKNSPSQTQAKHTYMEKWFQRRATGRQALQHKVPATRRKKHGALKCGGQLSGNAQQNKSLTEL